MSERFRKQIVRAALAALFAGTAMAASVPDRRAPRAPAPSETAPADPKASPADRQQIIELYAEIEMLQQLLREMRGQIEVQAHEIERLNKRQMESMVDFDRRLRDAERRAASVGSAPPAAIGAPPAPNAAKANTSTALEEQKQYDAAFALMKQGLYDQASKSFREFVARNPKSTLADNAQYWVGEVAYVTRDFRGALAEFGKIVSDYPNSAKMPDTLLKIGYSHQELGANAKAREVLLSVIVKYPNTAVAKAAEQRLAKLPK
jgi:tol-pal system protein YbgF